MAELTFHGRTFEARDRPSELRLMKLAEAGEAGMQSGMAGLLSFLRYVLADQWAAFEAWYDELDDAGRLGDNDLDTAIGGYLESVTDRPTRKPSTSPDGGRPDASTSRVVSLSRGLIRVESGDRTAGSSSDAAAG